MVEEFAQIRAIVQVLEGISAKAVVSVVLDATANMVETCPRDTSWARSNFVPKIGGDFEGIAGSRDNVEFGTQQNGIASVATGYKSTKQGVVSITNNVPYINALNHGHSKQESPGFIQRAIEKALKEIKL